MSDKPPAHDIQLMPIEDLADLYEHAPSGYFSLNAEGRIVKVNATMLGWLGFTADQLLGKRFNQLLSATGQILYETHFAPIIRMQGFVGEVVFELLRLDGSKLPVLLTANEKRDVAGEVIFTRIAAFQATERRRYERKLVAMRDDAVSVSKETLVINEGFAARIKEAVAARLQAELGLSLSEAEAEAMQVTMVALKETGDLRDQFIAILSHDLRNPIAALQSGLGLLDRQTLEPRARHILSLMRGSVHRMVELIDNVMDFARGRLGAGIEAVHQDNPLGPVLIQVVQELRLANPDRVIETDIELPDAIRCDQSRIGQLASNLLGNAISYGDQDKPIQFKAHVEDGMLELSVANAGKQIPAETKSRLFLPFFRGEGKASRKGLGLGLYIVSEIARAHGGLVDVSSTPAQTRFSFRMPVG